MKLIEYQTLTNRLIIVEVDQFLWDRRRNSLSKFSKKWWDEPDSIDVPEGINDNYMF